MVTLVTVKQTLQIDTPMAAEPNQGTVMLPNHNADLVRLNVQDQSCICHTRCVRIHHTNLMLVWDGV